MGQWSEIVLSRASCTRSENNCSAERESKNLSNRLEREAGPYQVNNLPDKGSSRRPASAMKLRKGGMSGSGRVWLERSDGEQTELKSPPKIRGESIDSKVWRREAQSTALSEKGQGGINIQQGAGDTGLDEGPRDCDAVGYGGRSVHRELGLKLGRKDPPPPEEPEEGAKK